MLSMNFDIPDDKRPPTITLLLNGVIIDRFVPDSGRVSRQDRVPAGSTNTLEIDVQPTYNAVRERTGDDPRELGILVRSLTWGGP